MFKDLKRIEILTILGIFIAYFLSRLVSLNNFPIFTDEAIYLRWAQIAKNDANWRFISLTDGKQPLYIWLTMVAMKVIDDPIMAGRLVSVLAGVLTILGLILLGKILFERWRVGILAAGLYSILPFALVYDRLALMDGLLASLMLWALIFEVLLIRSLRLDVALMLGGIIGLTTLTKTSGFIALYLLPVSLVFFDFRQKDGIKRLGKWLGLVLVVVIVSQMMYLVLRLSPFFNLIAQKDKTFVYPFFEWLSHPFTFFLGNLRGLADWVVTYLTWPLFLAPFIGLVWGTKFFKERLILFSWFIIPFIGLALFGRVIYPRFIFFMAILLLPLVAYFLTKLAWQKKWLTAVLLVALVLIPLRIDFDLLTNPEEASIPQADSNQYFNNWPSGWGIRESINFFQEKAKNAKITVLTEGTFGLLPAAIELYLVENKNISIKGIWPVPEKPTEEILKKAKVQPTYIIFYQNQPPPGWPLEKIMEVKKGKSERFHTLYQIKPLP